MAFAGDLPVNVKDATVDCCGLHELPIPEFGGFGGRGMAGFLSRRGLVGAATPFAPVLVGVALKFSLLDSAPASVGDHLLAQYLRSAWLDLLVTATITGVSWFLVERKVHTAAGIVFLATPLACFVLCIIFALGFPKAGVSGLFWTVACPTILGVFSLALCGNALATWSKVDAENL